MATNKADMLRTKAGRAEHREGCIRSTAATRTLQTDGIKNSFGHHLYGERAKGCCKAILKHLDPPPPRRSNLFLDESYNTTTNKGSQNLLSCQIIYGTNCRSRSASLPLISRSPPAVTEEQTLTPPKTARLQHYSTFPQVIRDSCYGI